MVDIWEKKIGQSTNVVGDVNSHLSKVGSLQRKRGETRVQRGTIHQLQVMDTEWASPNNSSAHVLPKLLSDLTFYLSNSRKIKHNLRILKTRTHIVIASRQQPCLVRSQHWKANEEKKILREAKQKHGEEWRHMLWSLAQDAQGFHTVGQRKKIL